MEQVEITAASLDLSLDELRRIAGDSVFSRGEEYCAMGQVLWLAECRGQVAAVVQGSRPYHVRLEISHGQSVIGICSCPAGDTGAFCKHSVAVALAWIQQAAKTDKQKKSRQVSLVDVEAWLRARPQEELIEFLVHEALNNYSMRERLMLAAANETGQGIDLGSYRRAIALSLSTALWSEGEDAGQAYLTDLKASLSNLAQAARWIDLQQLVEYAQHLLASDSRPSPQAVAKLRTFSDWLRRLAQEIPT
jgi:uncharacterized Zn finger protein